MQTKANLIALDSTCIIDIVEKTAQWWPHLEPVISDAENGNVDLLISEISVAECTRLHKLNSSDLALEDGVRLIQSWFDRGYLLRVPVDRRVSAIASSWIRGHKVETCDALIAVTAAFYGAKLLYTRDGYKKHRVSHTKLLALNGSMEYEGRTLKIEEPDKDRYREQGQLFET